VLPVFLPVAVAVLAGDSIAGEANIGTLRYLLIRPVGRTRLLVAKLVALIAFVLFAIERHTDGHHGQAFALGFGAALLRPMLERCDADGVPAYLEATSPRNRALYERHGFEVTEELKLPAGGPPIWLMWREPR
jgi:hypothetical protein